MFCLNNCNITRNTCVSVFESVCRLHNTHLCTVAEQITDNYIKKKIRIYKNT